MAAHSAHAPTLIHGHKTQKTHTTVTDQQLGQTYRNSTFLQSAGAETQPGRSWTSRAVAFLIEEHPQYAIQLQRSNVIQPN